MKVNGKLVVIGLDGGTFRVLGPLMDAGVMPTLARFMREGASGTLLSTRPPVTCPAWPTMFTGVNPGKHGVFSFTCRDDDRAKPHTASSLDVCAPAVWELVGQAGLPVGVMNVPITFPSRPVNGFMVAGFPAPDGSPHIVWPRMDFDAIRRHLPGFVVNWPGAGQRTRTEGKQASLVKSLNALMHARQQTFEYFLDRHDVDFCFLVSEYPDKVQHKFYSLLGSMNDALPALECSEVLRLLHHGYRQLDAAVARLTERFGCEANYVLVSDHGFGPVSRVVYVNHLLQQHGLLSAHRLKALTAKFVSIAKLPLGLRSRLGLAQQEPWHRLDTWRSPLVDYTHTRAFAGHRYEQAIYVNVEGRCPHGTVKPNGECNVTKQEVIEILRQARDPKTGARIFEGAWEREEIYTGPYVSRAPDVIYELAAGYVTSAGIGVPALLDGGFLRDAQSSDITGYHRPDGIFIGFGPAFRRVVGFEAALTDVAPTLLALLGIPIPPEMDGRVIQEAIDPGSLTIRHQTAKTPRSTREGYSSAVYSPDEEMEITRRLADLGYL